MTGRARAIIAAVRRRGGGVAYDDLCDVFFRRRNWCWPDGFYEALAEAERHGVLTRDGDVIRVREVEP